MSKRDDQTRLRHMLEAAQEALTFVVGKGRGDLDHDRILTLVLVKAIEIIREAASKISPELRDGRPEVPWAKFLGLTSSACVTVSYMHTPRLIWIFAGRL